VSDSPVLLLLLWDEGDWREASRCRSYKDPTPWFPEEPDGPPGRGLKKETQRGPGKVAYKLARAVCELCPVADACLEFALQNQIEDGMWGGLTPDEREQVRREREAAEARERKEAWRRHVESHGHRVH
jgi:WhiB family redox-sensing transcriptional regulator